MDKQERARSACAADDGPAFPVVGIGVPADGLAGLVTLLENLPPAPGMALVVLLRLPPDQLDGAGQALRRATGMPVLALSPGTPILPDRVHVIEPGYGLRIDGGQLLAGDPADAPAAPLTADRFFLTLAEAYKERAIGVVLSGMDPDAAACMAGIREQGGVAIAQCPDDAEQGGMPPAAAGFGMADFILTAAQIPARLAQLRDNASALHARASAPGAAPVRRADPWQALDKLLSLLCARSGHDFRQYKRDTVIRRIERRLQLRWMADLDAYCLLLEQDHDEADALMKDLMIGVTSFFRDHEAFDALAQRVLPQIFHGRGPDDQVRAWVTACATGEEAYSLGMLLAEHEAAMSAPPAVQVFATDINQHAIAVARAGVYPASIADAMPHERLQRHFASGDGQYKVRKPLRNRILFGAHDLLHDPPFAQLDLISCRNVLIYLNRDMHRRVLETFHFALKPGGYLFLGDAESADAAPHLFVPVDSARRIYQARPVARTGRVLSASAAGTGSVPVAGRAGGRSPQRERQPSLAEIHHRKLVGLASPSVLLDASDEILHVSERAGEFMRHASGEPSRNILSLALPELRLDLRTTLFQARKTGARTCSGAIRYQKDGASRTVMISALPFDDPAAGGPLMLLQFEELAAAAQPAPEAGGNASREQAFEDELRHARRKLEQAIERAKVSGAEMRGTNEALEDMVQALRLTIEELEIGREEAQSRNEELQTIIAELRMKVEETAKANDDLSNLIASTDIATLFLDRTLCIKRYTPRIGAIFNIIAADVGRPLAHITHRLDYPPLLDDIGRVFESLQPFEQEVRSIDGRDYIVRVHPYRTAEEQVEGVVATFFDISRRRQAEAALRQSEERFRLLVTASSDTLYRMSADWTEMRMLHGVDFLDDSESNGNWLEQYIPEDERPRVMEFIAAAIRNKAHFELEHRVFRADGGVGWGFSRAIPLLDAQGEIVEWFGAASDVTARKLSEAALRESEARFRTLADASPALIWQTDSEGNAVYLNQRYLDVTGLSPDELRATGWTAIVHPDDAHDCRQAYSRALAEHSPFQKRVRLRMADGGWHWFETHALPLFAARHEYRGHVGISIDVSDAVQAEEALKAADRRKDEFLAVLAHELRNPLAPVSNALHLLRCSEGRRHLDRLVEMADRQVGQMVRLVDDLMEITRITRGKIDLQRAPAPLAEILDCAVETSKPGFDQAGHRLSVCLPDETLVLDADKVRLTQVFVNLLNNAAKYTPAGGEIRLAACREGQQVLVTVRDNGMGIAAEQLPLIFEMFSQPHGADGRSKSGLGIGLAMVRSLLQLHEGTVEAHSDGIGQGSEFVVRLPLLSWSAAQARPDEAAAREHEQPLAGCEILVVDDNQDAADSLCHLLASRGAHVRAVYGGQAAFDMLETMQPDAIVLDIGMPGIDGYQVARRIRQDPRFDGMRIIALTGWGQHADRLRSEACGFDHHLTKPADLAVLQSLLAESAPRAGPHGWPASAHAGLPGHA